MGTPELLEWNTSRDRICNEIRSRVSRLKIVLKTKDDPLMLPRWIRHHEQIVDLSNLVIFDNGSTDRGVLDVYAELPPNVIVCSYSGFHNNLHDTRIFGELYSALRQSTDWFVFLDTDELLAIIKAEVCISDRTLVNILPVVSDRLLPGIWIYNYPGSDRLFQLDRGGSALENGIIWGKPIIGSQVPLEGFINHNSQCAADLFGGDELSLRFAVLHMAKLSAEQRIRSNLSKLKSRGVDVNAIPLSRDYLESTTFADSNVRLYLREILDLRERGEYPEIQSFGPLPNTFEVGSTQEISFASAADREWFNLAIRTPAAFLQSRIPA